MTAKPLMLCALVACAGTSRHPVTPTGHLTIQADTTADAELSPGSGAIDGVVIDTSTREGCSGAVVVLSPAGSGSETVGAADAHGVFRVAAGAGLHTLDAFCMDAGFTQRNVAVRAGQIVHVRIEVLAVMPSKNETLSQAPPHGLAGTAAASAPRW